MGVCEIVRLIDADALVDQAEEDMFDYEAEQFAARISWAPTVDAVKVVRCSTCKKYIHVIGRDDRKILGCRYFGMTVEPNDFCSHGERR